MRFIRLWDKPDKGPATSAKDIKEFRHLIHVLFVKGYILCAPGCLGTPSDQSTYERFDGLAGHCGRTITQIAFEQLLQAEKCEVHVMGRTKRMWWRCSKAEVLDMMKEVKSTVRAALERERLRRLPSSPIIHQDQEVGRR